ncbi:Protein yippee-like, partial [Melia azedarach]
RPNFQWGGFFLVELKGRSFYKCRFCNSHLALADNVLSWSFNCRRGRAYLFSEVVNIMLGPPEERLMLSGLHTVEDIFCCCCGQILGWKYVAAHEKNQKYKEGKFVLERWRITEEVTEELNLDAHPRPMEAETP